MRFQAKVHLASQPLHFLLHLALWRWEGLISIDMPLKALPVAELLLICRSQDVLMSEEIDS